MPKASRTILTAAAVLWISTFAIASNPVKQAESNFMRVHARLINNHPMAGDLDEANRNLAKAYRKINEVKREIISDIEAQPDVHQLDLQIRILNEAISRCVDVADRADLAGQVLDIKKSKSRHITDAFESSGPLMLAQADLDDATRHFREVQDQYTIVLRTDPALMDARNQIVAARRSFRVAYSLGG